MRAADGSNAHISIASCATATYTSRSYDLALLWAFRHIRPPEER